jgi:hypothetical protein
MSTLVCPQPRVLPNFSVNPRCVRFEVRLVLLLAFVLGTTGCASLNAGSTAAPTPTKPMQQIAISASLPPATVGSPYSAVVSVSGGTAPYRFATLVGRGMLPVGLRVDSLTGAFSGTPRIVGSYAFTLVVTDHAGTARGQQQMVLSVVKVKPPTPVVIAVNPAQVSLSAGAQYQFAAVASNASTPQVNWTASAGTVTATGLFTAPAVTATTTITLSATSKSDSSEHGFAVVTVNAASAPQASLSLTTSTLPDPTEGTPYSATLHASGGKTPYQWRVASGALPSGLILDVAQGSVNGLTSQTGPFSFTASVSDASGQSVSRKFSINVSAVSGGNSDGPAELPRVHVNSSLADTPAPGVVHLLKSGSNLQAALDSAKCGDTISLEAGGRFQGTFVLPAKSCDDNHWLIIRTSAPDSALPPEGTRLTPCQAGVASLPGRPAFACSSQKNVLAAVVFSGTGSGPIVLADGATHYRLLGLEITRSARRATVYNLVVNEKDGAADHIIFDRSWIHGTAQDETNRGIMLTGSTYVAVVDSFFSDFHCIAISGACGDSQAIAGGLGTRAMGPYKILNNYLEAAGENIIFGGGAATRTPEDIEIRRNFFFKPLTWLKGQPNFVGGADGHAFIVKNLFELKNAQRVLLEGNVFDNSWGGFSQVGFALLLTPKNPGGCSACLVRDVTIRYSKFSHTGAAMQIANGLSDTGFAALEGSHYSIHDLVFDDMFYPGCTSCNGVMFQLTTSPVAPANLWLHDVSIRHITVATNRAKAGWTIAGPAGQQNFAFEDSIVDSGVSANSNAGGGATQCYYNKAVIKGVLDGCWSHYTFSNNVIIGARGGQTWPAGNFAVGSGPDVGFVHWSDGIGGDYRLSASSPYKGKASDGKDPGADFDAIDAATAGVK